MFDTLDVATQQPVSHRHHRAADGTIRSRAGRFRSALPAECGLMARIAGLRPEHRWADWRDAPFDADRDRAVSVWRKP